MLSDQQLVSAVAGDAFHSALEAHCAEMEALATSVLSALDDALGWDDAWAWVSDAELTEVASSEKITANRFRCVKGPWT